MRTLTTHVLPTLLALGLCASPVEAATDKCTEDGSVCISAVKGARWQPEKKSTRRDRKRRGRGKAGSIKVAVEAGRASVFLNGRYAGTAPVDYLQVPAGNNDLQFRDGMVVLAEGLLTMPRGGSLDMKVLHP